MFTVLLDNGHGSNTPGKCSPKKEDGSRLREYAYTRKVVKALAPKLQKEGYNVILVTPEEMDIPLASRVMRINQQTRKYGSGNCLMVSVHCNAAGNSDKWMSGRGWSIWTTPGQNNSDKLATCIYEAANELMKKEQDYLNTFKGQSVQKPIRIDFSDKDADYEANFYIIKGANCPAVLTENFFQDNKEDVKFLESERGFNFVVNTHLQGIKKFIESKK